MVISAIWSILAGQNRGPYIRNPVYIQLMKYLLKVSAIPFHILDSTTLLEYGIWRDGRKAFNCRFFTQTCVGNVSLHPDLFYIISLNPD